jgi:hypothetical protein
MSDDKKNPRPRRPRPNQRQRIIRARLLDQRARRLRFTPSREPGSPLAHRHVAHRGTHCAVLAGLGVALHGVHQPLRSVQRPQVCGVAFQSGGYPTARRPRRTLLSRRSSPSTPPCADPASHRRMTAQGTAVPRHRPPDPLVVRFRSDSSALARRTRSRATRYGS